MYAMYILGIMLSVAMYLVAGLGNEQEQIARNRISARTAQQLTYHDYAKEYCKPIGNCNVAAEITAANVTSVMPSVMSGATSYSDGRFLSFTDGAGLVVTISADHNFYVANNDQSDQGTAKMINERSALGVQLRKMAGVERAAGRYDSTTGSLTSYDGTVVAVPNTIAGTTFQDDVPMVAEN